jgi:hypothetical protein
LRHRLTASRKKRAFAESVSKGRNRLADIAALVPKMGAFERECIHHACAQPGMVWSRLSGDNLTLGSVALVGY